MPGFPKRWPRSSNEGALTASILIIFIGGCSLLISLLAAQSKQMEEGYINQVSTAGYSVPPNLDEALSWIYEAENIPSMNGVWLPSEAETSDDILVRYSLPTSLYGWHVVGSRPSYCTGEDKNTWKVKVYFVVNQKIVEELIFDQMKPTSNTSSTYSQQIDTGTMILLASTSFDRECEDSVTSFQVLKK